MTRRRNQPEQPEQPVVAPDPDAAAREWLAGVFRRQQASNVPDDPPDDDATPLSMDAMIRRALGRSDAA